MARTLIFLASSCSISFGIFQLTLVLEKSNDKDPTQRKTNLWEFMMIAVFPISLYLPFSFLIDFIKQLFNLLKY